MTRRLLRPMLAFAFALLAPASAGAADALVIPAPPCHGTQAKYMQCDPPIVRFTAQPGEANRLTISPGEAGAVRFHDVAVTVHAGSGCSTVDEHTVSCGSGGPVRTDVGDLDDVVDVVGLIIDLGRGGSLVQGGPGDDRITGAANAAGGPGNDTLSATPERTFTQLSGDAGDNALAGGRGADVIDGGPGDDNVEGGRGRDRLAGGAGDDALEAGSERCCAYALRLGSGAPLAHDGGERVSCGAGRDRVEGFDDVLAPDCERLGPSAAVTLIVPHPVRAGRRALTFFVSCPRVARRHGRCRGSLRAGTGRARVSLGAGGGRVTVRGHRLSGRVGVRLVLRGRDSDLPQRARYLIALPRGA